MDRNSLIIGGAIIIIGGAIATGAILSNGDQSSSDKKVDDGVSQELTEEQNFKDWENEEKFSFCQGVEEIKGIYTSSIMGSEKGNVEYTSEDISVLDKEKNRLYILGRKIKYKYSGDKTIDMLTGSGSMQVEEEGMTTEYYTKNTAPVRIDFNSKIINPAPERKNNDWVVINTKGEGTLMGLTDTREDTENGDAKVFCASFNLSDAFVTPEYISFEKTCPNYSPTPEASFSGNFKYACGGIDNERGLEIVNEYKKSEEIMNEFNSISDEGGDDSEDNSGGTGSNEYRPETSEELKVRLKEALDEINSGN
jgi:hypothetical protein